MEFSEYFNGIISISVESCVYHGRTKEEGIDLSFTTPTHPHPHPSIIFADRSGVVYCFCHCMTLHVCPGEIFILDSRLA